VDLIQGDPGQKVTLTVLHEGSKEPVDIDIVRRDRGAERSGDRHKSDDEKEWEYVIDRTTRSPTSGWRRSARRRPRNSRRWSSSSKKTACAAWCSTCATTPVGC
jgi:hypothetical protein